MSYHRTGGGDALDEFPPTTHRMSRTLRIVLAILAGTVVAMIGAFVVDQVGMWLYPLPSGMNMRDTSMADVLASRPVAALAFNSVFRLPMIVLGGFVAGKLATTAQQRNGFIVGVLFCAFAIGPAFIVHIPVWFIVSSILIMPLCGYAGGRLAMSGTAPRA